MRQKVPKSERGSAMLAALCFALVFTVSLTSYIALSYTNLIASSRNFMSARCVEIAEMGMEEALYSQNYVNANNTIGNWTSDNWTASGNDMGVTMTLTAAGLVNSATNPAPLNLGNGATATVQITVHNYASSSPPSTSPWISSQAVVAFPDGAGGTHSITRTLTAGSSTSPLTSAPLFVNALAATAGTVYVNFCSPANLVDSYNSTVGPYAANSGYAAVVMSQTSGVYLFNSVLHGYAVAPVAGVGPPASANVSHMGSAVIKGATTPITTSIDTNQIIANPAPFQPAFKEFVPSSGINAIAGIYGSRSLGVAGATTYYSTPIVSLQSPGLTLTITGRVVLIVGASATSSTTTFAIGQGANLQISTGSELQVMLEGGSMNISDSLFWGAAVNNLHPNPKASQFVVLAGGNPGGTGATVTLSLNNPLFMAVYAPNHAVTLSSLSAGAGSQALYGSVVGQSISDTNIPIHYDAALQSPVSAVSNMAFNNIYAPAVAVANLQWSPPLLP